jgi:hypothetical protein
MAVGGRTSCGVIGARDIRGTGLGCDCCSGRAAGALASSRREDGRTSPLTISFTNEAAKVVDSFGQDCSQTRSPASPHKKKGRISSKREPPLLNRKVTWENSVPTSSGADQ